MSYYDDSWEKAEAERDRYYERAERNREEALRYRDMYRDADNDQDRMKYKMEAQRYIRKATDDHRKAMTSAISAFIEKNRS